MSSVKPRHVAIAGSGVGGLATALALLRYPGTGVEHVTVFDPRPNLDSGLGAALNLNSGAAVLEKCYGVPVSSFGRSLERVIGKSCMDGRVLLDVNVTDTVFGSAEARRTLVHQGRSVVVTVMRDRLLRAIADRIPDDSITFCRGLKVRDVVCDDAGKFRLEMQDGALTSQQFDLVVGADGLHSAVRGFVDGNARPPKYSGIRVQFCVAPPGGPSKLSDGVVEQWFGDGAYVLRYAGGTADSRQEVLALSFTCAASANENPGYKSDFAVKADCEARLKACRMPNCVMETFYGCNRFIETSVYYHPVLRSWSREGGCTLVGDAG